MLSLATFWKLVCVSYESSCSLCHILGGEQMHGFEGPSRYAHDGSRELRQLILGFRWRLEASCRRHVRICAPKFVGAEVGLVGLSVAIKRICLESIYGMGSWADESSGSFCACFAGDGVCSNVGQLR